MTQQFGPLADDLTPLATSVLGADWNQKISPSYQAFVVDGKLTALPIGSTVAGTLIVNKTLLDKYNLAVPDQTTTLAQWQQMCATLKQNGKQCLAFGAKDGWQATDLFQTIADQEAPGKFSAAVAGTGQWTDPALVSAFADYQKLFSNGVIQQGAVGQAAGDVITSFAKQDAAMVFVGTWGLNLYLSSGVEALQSGSGVKTPAQIVVLFTPLPDVAGKGNPAPLFGDADHGEAINPQSTNKQAADALITWLDMSQSGQQYVANSLTVTPSLKGVVPQPSGLVDTTVQSASLQSLTTSVQNVSEARQINYPDLVTALQDALQQVAVGTTPDQAAATLQSTSAGISRS